MKVSPAQKSHHNLLTLLTVTTLSALSVLLITKPPGFFNIRGLATTATDTTVPGVYWGAWIDGSTYGSSYADSPWDLLGYGGNTTQFFESHAGKAVSIIHFGQPWQSGGSWVTFNPKPLDAIRSHGSIPLMDWGTWNCCSSVEPAFTNSTVASGVYDSYITAWATAAKNWGNPFFLRFDWEMNGWWQFPWAEGTQNGTNINSNPPGSYAAMYKHVHDIFTAVGANNVTWVWCPNIYGPNSTTSSYAPFSQVYPGGAYVDWSCLDGYNKNSSWLSFKQLFMGKDAGVTWLADSYQDVLNLTGNKPLMVGETGSLEAGDGGAKKNQWFTDALLTDIPTYFPGIKAIVYFNWNDNNVVNTFPIESSSLSQQGFAQGIALPYYATNQFSGLSTTKVLPLTTLSAPVSSLSPTPSPAPTLAPVLVTADTVPPSVSIVSPAAGSIVPRHTSLVISSSATDNVGVTKVEILVNGFLLCTDLSSPYSCQWSVSGKPQASYQLQTKAYDAAGNIGTNSIQVTSSQ